MKSATATKMEDSLVDYEEMEKLAREHKPKMLIHLIENKLPKTGIASN